MALLTLRGSTSLQKHLLEKEEYTIVHITAGRNLQVVHLSNASLILKTVHLIVH